MPGGNRTGPMGAGPMTGRGAGYCAGSATPGLANPGCGGFGCGMARGFGRGGFGFRHRRFAGYMPQVPRVSSEQEKGDVKNNIEFLEEELKAAKERLNELER